MRENWKYFYRLFSGQYGKLAATLLGSAAQALLIVPAVFLVRYAFDVTIPGKDIRQLILIGILIFTIRFVNSAATVWLRNIHINIINKAIFRVRDDLLTRLYRFSRSFHTREDQKIIHARIVQDTERLGNLGNAIVSRIAPALIISLALAMVLIFLNWFLFLITVLLVPLIFLANRFIGKSVRKRVFVFQRAFESFSKGIFFVLRYMDLTTIQSAQNEEIERQRKILEELRDKTGKMAIIYTINSQVQEIISNFIGIIIIIIGGAAVATQRMTLGEFISFYMAAVFLNKYVNSITTSIPDIIAGNESLDTLYRLVSTEESAPYQGTEQFSHTGLITLDDVSFRYDEKTLLKHISLNIIPSSRIAIIGPNSAGKTTIINLILGFYKPENGILYAEGIPYYKLDMSNLRKSFGVVMQHPLMFSGSIRENILYGIDESFHSNLYKSCEISLADEFIKKLPNGYETQIGEDGVLISGGECQRIAIARALVRQPKLLILDEPTNHLDNQVVKEIMDNLKNLENSPAVLLISHDMSVVHFAKTIFKLQEGQLIPYND